MQPRSFSATALQTAEACLARYKAEHIDYARGVQNTAASLGTSVHGALEAYVKSCYIEKTSEPTLQYLLDLFKLSYMKTFGNADFGTDDFADGEEMLTKWFARTDFSTFEVVSCEIKSNIPINTSLGKIPFNYIWDRFDKINSDEYRVADYKTNRAGVRPEDLRKKIQVRAYALAAQIEYPEAKRIWVELDMLRHDGPVGVSFTREDNAAFWKYLKLSAQRIIDTPDDKVPESLNPDCGFCVRKSSCVTLLKNIAAGGAFSHGTAVEMVDLRAQLEWQKKAVMRAIDEIDVIILSEARESEVYEFLSDIAIMEVSVSSKRAIDSERVEMVIGPDLFKKYGSTSITLASIDRLLKGAELDEQKKKQLSGLIRKQSGEPRIVVKARNPIDE